MTIPDGSTGRQVALPCVTDGYTLEITAADAVALSEIAPRIPPATPVSVTFLAGEPISARVDAARLVRELGFEPMPHFSARCIASHAEFEEYLERVVAEAQVRQCFVVAGDPAVPAGPFADSASMIATGAFERAGITTLGVGGHPDGHPVMSREQCWEALHDKCTMIADRGMDSLVVTQFGFDADAILSWLTEMRERDLTAPVRLGAPGPAGIKTLLRFAARCGVGASASVLSKYGVSITRLIGTAGPDRMVDEFARRLGPEHGDIRLHFYPFGGLRKTVDWIEDYAARNSAPIAFGKRA